MPKCPVCKEEISHLVFIDLAMSDYDGISYQDMQYLDGEGKYQCPYCCAELFDREDKAEEFFNDEAID